MSTKTLTLDERFPRVSDQRTRIYSLETELKTIQRKEQNLIATKEVLIHQRPSEKTDQELKELRTQIVATQSQKINAEDYLRAAKEDMPKIQFAAMKAETDLADKKAEIKTIRSKIKEIDKKLIASLREPLRLLKKRQETISNFEKVDLDISTLTSTLRWHPPEKEHAPLLPEILTELQEFLPGPKIVQFRGKKWFS